MAIGRVSGTMLKDNLTRNGVDLILDTNLTYFDVNNRRVGINTTLPGNVLTVNGNATVSSIFSNTYYWGNGSPFITSSYGNTEVASYLTVYSGNLENATLGANTVGSLISNAVTLTSSTTLTNGIAQLNKVLGKLVPASPGNFPNAATLSINSVTNYRMAFFPSNLQTDNTSSSRSAAAGTTISALRVASYTTNTLTRQGPGDSGTVTVYKNGVSVGSRALITGSDNGTYGNLVISNDVDYATLSGQAGGFWESFSCYATQASGVLPGWNEVYINHSGSGASTNTPYWYYDASAPGTPAFTSTSIAVLSNSSTFSSTIPHFNSSATFTCSFNVSRLSGDTYPTSDTFATGVAGGAFGAPTSLTYSSASIPTPLGANLYVANAGPSLSTTSTIISGFSSSSTGPGVTVTNGYNSATNTFSPGVTVLYKTGTSNQIEETTLTVNSTVGTGAGSVSRIVNPGSTDTPTFSASAATFNSTSSTLQTYDATVVAAILKHDTTNYSTGYLPVGPNLSSGRSGAQYFTFKFVRTSLSKFNIKYTGNVAGMYVALPGSTIDTSSTLNGWLDLSIAYAGSGVPGAGGGGNGSNGGAVGGPITPNSSATNANVTATFGTISSSSTSTNEIYVRLKLTPGQTVSLLQIGGATN
jgi:hypothetical protein